MVKEMETSDFNLEKLGTEELSAHTNATIQMEGTIAVFGRRGSGKTEIAKQQIKESSSIEVYINLSVLERVDLGGYPNIMAAEQKQNFVNFLLPIFYQHMVEGNRSVVALLDEVDKADPSLWGPLLEFVQYRSINGRKLPNLKAIIMTGNLIAEGGLRPSLPLLDRSEKYLLEVNSKDWLEWAGKQGHIHPSISSYIMDNPEELYGELCSDDKYADPSPRGWERASNILNVGEKFKWDAQILLKKVGGCVGKSAALKYSNYYEHYRSLLPMINKLFMGHDVIGSYNKLEPTKKIITAMIACSRLANLLDKSDVDNLPNSVDYVGQFLNRIDSETALIASRSQIQEHRIRNHFLDERKDWKLFIDKINKQMEE